MNAKAASDSFPFSPADVVVGRPADRATCSGPERVWVAVEGAGDCLRVYGAGLTIPKSIPLVLLDGDVVESGNRDENNVVVWAGYGRLSPAMMQLEADQYAGALARPFVNLARPGTFGSSGDHLQRRREREIALVDAALDDLKAQHGWSSLDLVGQSGGGHLVASLLARRADIRCAVIASGNTAVRMRYEALGATHDMTGYADSVDPIEHVGKVARHPPERLVVLTDSKDLVVAPVSQNAYVAALRNAGVHVDQRFVPAFDPKHHLLRQPVILAAASCGAELDRQE